MESPSESMVVPGGASFFDSRRRNLGWASSVSRRKPSLGGLTVLDVITSEAGLTASLVTLDHARLLVQGGDSGGSSWDFAWASGYANGHTIRIQGVLSHVFSGLL